MNPRERLLAIGVLSIVVALGLGFLGYQFYVVPLRERDESIATLKQEIGTKRDRIQQVLADKPKLERWKQLSLPADADLARREYEKFLGELLRLSKYQAGSYTVTSKPVDARGGPALPGKKEQPIYTRLSFTVMAHGDLASLVTLLDRFYHTGLLHEIKTLSIQRPLTNTGPSQQQQANGLDVNLTIEALIVQGAENRPNLLPGADPKLLAINALTALQRGPAGLALVPVMAGPGGPLGPRVLASPPRQYASIPAKNIFFGVAKERPPSPVDPTDVKQFVYLTDITQNETRTEAWLFDRYNNRRTRLRSSAGFDSFRIYGNDGEPLIQGKVVRIDDRDVVFRVGEKYYSLHVGQNLMESMSHEMKADQVQSLGLSAP